MPSMYTTYYPTMRYDSYYYKHIVGDWDPFGHEKEKKKKVKLLLMRKKRKK